jgi:DNA mismatch repair protein MSH2
LFRELIGSTDEAAQEGDGSTDAAEGTALIGEILKSWAAKTAHLDRREGGDDDVDMEGDGDDEVKVAEEYEELKRCLDEYKDRLEGNAWVRQVLLGSS